MAPNIILTAKFDDFKPVFWSGKEIYTYSSQLKNYISQNLGAEYADVFAEPVVSQDFSKIRWLSETISSNAQKITQLSEIDQSAAKIILKSKIEKINQFAEGLKNSSDAEATKWAEIIQNATNVPSFDYVYFENGNVALTAWGFETVSSVASNFVLSKEIEKEKTPPVTTPPPITNDVPPTDKQPEKNLEEKQVVTNNQPPVTQDVKKEDVIETKEVKQEPEKNKKKSIFSKWWFWLILALLIGALIFFLFFCCKSQTLLPDEEAVVPPIDTTKIIEDSTGRQVISDQLILYIGSPDKTVDELAQDFKKLYPSGDYRVIYYNSQGVKRINIQFPADEKQNLKQNLKTQLPDYNLVIVDEAIFEQEVIPTDPAFSDNDKSWSYNAVKVYPAWDVTEGDPNIIVAIIDDGFDLTHPEFEGKIINPFNVPMGNDKPNVGSVGMYHGTHVASTSIGNVGNSFGLCGIAPNCKFMPIQVGDRNGLMSTTAIIDGIFYAIDKGANVINMSLGMPVPEGTSSLSLIEQQYIMESTFLEEQELWEQIFKVCDDNNVTVVLAGGNDDVIIGLDPMQRTEYTINVSAIDPNFHKADFSNYGKLSTISAPGVEIFSALPNDDAGFLQGTSMAAPMVTGGVALLKSLNPDLTTAEIIEILQQTGVELNSPKYIGNLMQLSVALGAADSIDFSVDCPEIQEQIDSLLAEIDRLKDQCRQQGDTTADQLIIPDDPNDFNFAEGLWKSTSDLHNTLNNKSVELYFEFNADGTGEVTFVEVDGNKCYSDLTLALDNNSFSFAQTGEALCDNSERYLVHTFVCESENNEVANCVARTSDGDDLIHFTLERIR